MKRYRNQCIGFNPFKPVCGLSRHKVTESLAIGRSIHILKPVNAIAYACVGIYAFAAVKRKIGFLAILADFTVS